MKRLLQREKLTLKTLILTMNNPGRRRKGLHKQTHIKQSMICNQNRAELLKKGKSALQNEYKQQNLYWSINLRNRSRETKKNKRNFHFWKSKDADRLIELRQNQSNALITAAQTEAIHHQNISEKVVQGQVSAP